MRNEKEIRVVGTKRSGHHAIVYWLEAHFAKPILVNDCEPSTNPFDNAAQIRPPGTDLSLPKEGLIINYEDRHLEDVFSAEAEEKNEAFVGPSGETYDVLVLRDAYNYVASRMKLQDYWIRKVIPDIRTPVGQKYAIGLWKEHAREFLGQTSIRKKRVVNVSYNMWFRSEKYRRELSAKFGLEFTDAGRNTVKGVGESSFNRTAMNGRGSEMKVLDRYQEFMDDDVFKKVFDDDELRTLSHQIFPAIKPFGA